MERVWISRKNVIDRGNMPVELPGTRTLVIVLALDYWNAPDWFKYLVWAYLVLLWILCFTVHMKQKEVNIFEHTYRRKKPYVEVEKENKTN